MDHTARLDLPFIIGGQALKHITHNEALDRLDALVQPVVESTVLATPPTTPLPGEAYVVPAGAGGAWAGHGGELAAYQAGAWEFYDPARGWLVFDRDSGALKAFDGAAWTSIAAIGPGLEWLGINASADATNRLAVSAAATLLSHDGAGHQLKINKAEIGDTASVLFQTDWSGRAEMGLAGDDSWRLKVSTDGTGWTEALAVDAETVVVGGALLPAADNAQALGSSTARWSAVWAATGTLQTSDARLKTGIAPSDLGLDFICALKPVRFRWRDGAAPGIQYGLLAHEVAEAAAALGAPEFGGHVPADPASPKAAAALRYDAFIAPLIGAVQELARRVAALEDGITS